MMHRGNKKRRSRGGTVVKSFLVLKSTLARKVSDYRKSSNEGQNGKLRAEGHFRQLKTLGRFLIRRKRMGYEGNRMKNAPEAKGAGRRFEETNTTILKPLRFCKD
ncbi:hypothetical protein HPP92_012433 [Vanilla planifolia]|uniref:Uncharacterized protein n=1 Tax=Vanilla planifolia TaxID=51239 RepID=A0A835UVT9_VANPL|nr:hypothetical protein HPP92_012433 [Vanilla planifolia]